MESFFSASQEEKDLKPKDLFKRLAKAAAKPKDKDWRTKESLRRSSMKRDQIGSTTASIKRHQSSLKKSMLKRGSSQADIRMCLTRCRAALCYTILKCNAGLTLKNWWLSTPCCQITLLPLGSFSRLCTVIGVVLCRRAYAIFKTALTTYNEENSGSAVTSTEQAGAGL